MAVYLEGQLQIDIMSCYRILSTQNEGGLGRLPVRHPRRALDGGLTGGCFGNSSILGGHSSKADFYHLIRVVRRAIQEIQNSGEEYNKFFVRIFSMCEKAATSLHRLHAVNWLIDLSVDSIQKEIDISHTIHGLPWMPAKEIVDLTWLREVLGESGLVYFERGHL